MLKNNEDINIIDNNMMLQNRITKIKDVISEYGEENFYISFSGGKDSSTMSRLIDIAIPGNKIPRVYVNTGIEFKMMVDFVRSLQEHDDRIVIITPSVNIKKVLETSGYPFKSKYHSSVVEKYEKDGCVMRTYVKSYYDGDAKSYVNRCPRKLMYQFEGADAVPFKISDKCCDFLKKYPLNKYMEESGKKYSIIGIRRAEGGRRRFAACTVFSGSKLKSFQPLSVVSDDWVDWFVDKYNVELCDLYKPPYNMKRTGCKGCPFDLELDNTLKTLEKYLPSERKQCEYIFGPVYKEYRRIGFRLFGGRYKKYNAEYVCGDSFDTAEEYALAGRLSEIKSVVDLYGEENFYISFSGGRKSVVLSRLFDMAVPGNKIPRVYVDNGMDYMSVNNFVSSINDDRIVIVRPEITERQFHDEYGFPMKNYDHSRMLARYQKYGEDSKSVMKYLGIGTGSGYARFVCPEILKHQFTDSFDIKVTHKCCNEMMHKPLRKYAIKNRKYILVRGITNRHNGYKVSSRRTNTRDGRITGFDPLVFVDNDWIDWFVDEYRIELCNINKDPINIRDTKCKGCPYDEKLKHHLNILKDSFSEEYKWCYDVYKDVYDEYEATGMRCFSQT